MRGMPMLSGIYLNLFVIATGFVTAGILSASVQLVTGRPLGFSIPRDKVGFQSIVSVVTRVVAGPVILLRNAIHGRQIEGRGIHWLVMSSAIATAWSFFSGVVVIETFLTLSGIV